MKSFFRSLLNPSYEVYTDGSSKRGQGSWAYVILRRGRILRENAGRVRRGASTEMEFQAAIEALSSLPCDARITLYSDSRILIDAMTASDLDRENTYLKPQKELLKHLCDSRQIVWKWVKAHAGNTHNERCDELCVQARETP